MLGMSGISKFPQKHIFCKKKKNHLIPNKLLTLRKFITSLEGLLKHFTMNLMGYFIKVYQNYYLNNKNLSRVLKIIENSYSI